MINRTLVTLLLIIMHFPLCGQIRLPGYQGEKVNPALYMGQWPARWISMPDEPADIYGVYHFRKTFELDTLPQHFWVHVSADNRYKLYINGSLVSLGPARGNVFNWNFETVDLSSCLRQGKNVLAAVVWNYGDKKPLAQMSFNRTGFIVQGNTAAEAVVNTNDTWVCIKNGGYSTWETPVCGYYVAGPGELLDAASYPWGWEQSDYDDSGWVKARQELAGSMKGGADYPGRLLVPTPIPPMDYKVERFSEVRKADGVRLPGKFPSQKQAFTVPANSKIHLILDQGQLTTGYLSMFFSGGRGTEVRLGYTEAYYSNPATGAKDNRNELDGKMFVGYEDKIICDGGNDREYTNLWWRTWRYVDVRIETKNEPLVIEDLYSTYSAYPFVREARFVAPENEYLENILEIGWRTARLCANETYMDCPYYEQLQYLGDTRIQAMITLYNTHDTCMVKNALEQGRQSIVADGITMGRYPTNSHQFISSFSLWWIGMGYDYWMYRGDEAYLKTLLPAYRTILAWYEQWLKPDHTLGYVPYWFFADWAEGFPNGEPVREKDGNSALQDLMYLLTLESVVKMEKAFGLPAMGEHYAKIASAVKVAIRKKYWDVSRGLFADTYKHNSFSQHVNSLAVLAGVITGDEARQVMHSVLTGIDLIQVTIYFRYYLNQALNKAGLGDELLEHLGVWKEQMALGLTTWAERPEPSRSDCHAWGASPNIEFYRVVLGIDSDAPGFGKVRIAPNLGTLKKVSGTVPHPLGDIAVNYEVDKKGKLIATVDLPENIKGTFVWKGQNYPLVSGHQAFTINQQASAGQRKYYVSSSTGDDSNDGLTPKRGFKTLAKASQLRLFPGDSLLLRAGDIWLKESLFPVGSGRPENPIVISSYGKGARPHIKPGHDAIYGIRIVNDAGYKIKGLEVSDCYGGIVVWEENTYNHEYIWIEDCYFHDITDKDEPIGGGRNGRPVTPDLIYGMGVSICGADAFGGRTLLSDITITKCKFDRCDVGIEVIGRDYDDTGEWRRHGHDLISAKAFLNVNISDCDVQRSYRTGGVMLYCITGGTAENIIINETGYEGIGMWWGVAAFQCARVHNYLVENCTFSNTIKGKSPDGQGFDFEADVHDVVVRKCRFINNEGPAVLYYGDSWAGINKGCVIDSCYIEGNNWSTDGDYVGKVFGVGKPANEGIIKNTEIHLRTDDQTFDCAPIVFDASNRVYNTTGKLIYGTEITK